MSLQCSTWKYYINNGCSVKMNKQQASDSQNFMNLGLQNNYDP
jgi:hypothetical protein